MRPTFRAFFLFLAALPLAIVLLALAPSYLPAAAIYAGTIIFLFLFDWFNCSRKGEIVISINDARADPGWQQSRTGDHY